jgi:hypothetical protein
LTISQADARPGCPFSPPTHHAWAAGFSSRRAGEKSKKYFLKFENFGLDNGVHLTMRSTNTWVKSMITLRKSS